MKTTNATRRPLILTALERTFALELARCGSVLYASARFWLVERIVAEQGATFRVAEGAADDILSRGILRGWLVTGPGDWLRQTAF